MHRRGHSRSRSPCRTAASDGRGVVLAHPATSDGTQLQLLQRSLLRERAREATLLEAMRAHRESCLLLYRGLDEHAAVSWENAANVLQQRWAGNALVSTSRTFPGSSAFQDLLHRGSDILFRSLRWMEPGWESPAVIALTRAIICSHNLLSPSRRNPSHPHGVILTAVEVAEYNSALEALLREERSIATNVQRSRQNISALREELGPFGPEAALTVRDSTAGSEQILPRRGMRDSPSPIHHRPQ